MALVSMIHILMKRKVWMSCQNANHFSHWCHSNSENKKIQRLKVTVFSKIMFSFQPNKLGQIYVKWYIKTYILGNVSACSVGRKTGHCAMLYKMRKEEDILKKEDQYDHMMIQIWMPSWWTCSEPMIFLIGGTPTLFWVFAVAPNQCCIMLLL